MKLLSALAVSLLLAGPVSAQDWDKGFAAYEAGDYATALQEWRPLAEQGNTGAQAMLGIMYMGGDGVLQDYAEAVKWYRLAAEQGFAAAQYKLGGMYRNGSGVLRDNAEAAQWYRLAAEQGHAWAQAILGAMYEYGDGVLQDDVLAHMWFNISGANGVANGSEKRGEVEKRMTREQIAEAQALARRCMASDYQDCE